ncbi:MAG: serine/threonine-protein kinase [Calditrichaceae bacterium]
MEYVDGPSLAEILKKTAIDETRALNYLKQILSTMAFAHDNKILHRDIKPSNILINSKDIVKVVDFGIAKMMDRKGLTSTGLTMGSPWYMSPEQIMGYELDARSDIYSLGITLFEMLSGQVPFNDTSEYKIYEMHQKKPIPSVREINKKLSTDIDAIIQKATAKDPNERYQNAMEFSEAVDIYLAL